MTLETFDIVIVGAGSAGSVVAGRLAASDRFRILVVEAGPNDWDPWLHIPIGYGRSYYSPRVNWMYRTEPVPGLDNRVIYQPRGKVVGGSGAINAMVFVRGQPEDFDTWAQGGNTGWAWQDLLPLYRKMEDHALGESEHHGASGPIRVTDIARTAHPLTHRFVEAGQEAGLPFNPDFNGAVQEGVGYYQINTRGGLRCSSGLAYLRPAVRSGRVRLETNALVTRLLIEGRRVVGVEYMKGSTRRQVKAAAEVILCGGSINTPQLLQWSGIGPAAHLRGIGIDVVADAPAVGANLQDHLCYDHAFRSRERSLNEQFLPLTGKLGVGLRYLLTRDGPLAMSVNQGGGFFRVRPGANRPDMQLYFSPLSYERAVPGVRALMKPDPFPGFLTSISPCRPTSRGTVRARSADPREAPAIAPNYLSTEEDVADILAGARFLRRLTATPTLSRLVEEELKPGKTVRTDDELLADVRARAYSVFHPCGTCRMGPDPASDVVDPTLKSHHVGGLRIADASIFPTIPSGNTNAPAMLVGEKAAELILRELA